MKLVRCYWRTDRTCPHPTLCHYGYECVARPKGKATMPTVISGELLATLKGAEALARQIVERNPHLFPELPDARQAPPPPAPPSPGARAEATNTEVAA